MSRPRVGLAVAVALLGIAACSSGPGADSSAANDPDSIAVASFNFPESELLAEIYSQALESEGYEVERVFNLGPRELVVPALIGGLIDFVPEYAGTAVQFLSAGRVTAGTDPTSTNTALGRAAVDLSVRALAPAPAQDANAFVVDAATAERHGLESLSDLADVAGSLVFGGPPECETRPLCLVGLEETYGITFGDVVTLDAGGALTHQALDAGGIDVALLFTTDAELAGGGLVELTDDRNLQPAENVTPLVHEDVLARWGDDLAAVVDATSAALTTAELRELNEQVASGESDLAAVAAAWLAAEGLT